MNYRDIPKEERRKLESEVRATVPRVRKLAGVAAFCGLICGIGMAGALVGKHESPWMNALLSVAITIGVTWIVWSWIGAPVLRSEIEKRKNA